MPILPSHELGVSSSPVHSPSAKHASSPISSTASTPSASSSPSVSPQPIDHRMQSTVLHPDEQKFFGHPASPAPLIPPMSVLPAAPSTVQLPVAASNSISSDETLTSDLSMSPTPSSYAAYPPPLHPSMVNINISPLLKPQSQHQQLAPAAYNAMLHDNTAALKGPADQNATPPASHPVSSPFPMYNPTATMSWSNSNSSLLAGFHSVASPPESMPFLSPESASSPTPSSPDSIIRTSFSPSSTSTPSPYGHQFSPHFSMFTCVLNPALSVTCFRRGGPDGARLGPLFVVREFDAKVIRSSPKLARPHSTTANGEPSATSEQAFRASIRQAMLNMNLRPENASKSEIRVLKAQGILGKRAPSASLLTAEDCCRLLIAFHKEECAKELRDATLNWKEVEAQWLENQQRTADAGGAVDMLADFTSKGVPIGKAFTHVPLKEEPEEGGQKKEAVVSKPVVPHIIKVGEGIDEESMQVEKGPTKTKAELKEIRERERQEKKEEKEQLREQKRLEREAKKEEKELLKEEKKKRKRKADASPMLSAAPTDGMEALLSAVDASGSVQRASSALPNVIRALSTPPSVEGRSSLVAQGLSFRLPSAAVHSNLSGVSVSLPLHAPQPRRPQTPIAFTSTLKSSSPSPTSISPTSTHPSTTSAFSSPTAHTRSLPQPPPATTPTPILDRQHSGSTSPTNSDAADPADRLALSRVLSTDSERAEREQTRVRLGGFGLAQMDEGKAEMGGGVEMDKRDAGHVSVDKEMTVVG